MKNIIKLFFPYFKRVFLFLLFEFRGIQAREKHNRYLTDKKRAFDMDQDQGFMHKRKSTAVRGYSELFVLSNRKQL